MDTFTLILCVLAAVVLSSFLSRFLPKISTPLVQIALGVLATYLPFFPNTELDPELFMVLFIAPLLYLEAHEIDKSALFKSLKISLSLAIGLAIATMVAVGFTVHTFWPAIPLAAAFALGAALGPTDAVAVSSLGKEAALTQRQLSVLKGESLFNDASGIVGFQFSILAAVTGVFSFGEAAGEFVVSFIGGTLFGLAVGLVVNWLFETIRSLGWETTTTRILMELFLPFLLYLAAEDIAHVSGILAVVACGLLIRFDHTGIGPNVARTNIVSSSVWAVLSFSLNGAVFILLGMLLPDAMSRSWEDPGVSNPMLISVILLVALVVIAMRFLWVAAVLRVTKDQHTGRRRRMTPERWRSAAVMTFGGPKGTITLSLMLTIPFFTAAGDLFPMRDELIFIASGVIIVTLLLANFLLPLIAPNRGTDDSHEITEITIDVLRRTVEELTQRITPENRACGADGHRLVYQTHHQAQAAHRRRGSARLRAAADRRTVLGEGLHQGTAGHAAGAALPRRPRSGSGHRGLRAHARSDHGHPASCGRPRFLGARGLPDPWTRARPAAPHAGAHPPRHQQDPAHHAVAQRG